RSARDPFGVWCQRRHFACAGRGSGPAVDGALQPAPRDRAGLPALVRSGAMRQALESSSLKASVMASVFLRRRIGLSLACLLGGGVLRLPAAEQKPTGDWPVFRGNALQTGVASSSLPPHLQVLWKFQAKDSVEATAAIANGTVYVGSLDENLYALDLATGKQKWAYKAGPLKSPVAVRDGAVYVGNTDNTFHCVDAATGQKRWTYDTEAPITSGANFASDSVLFGCDDETLSCLTREGKERWKFKVPGGPVMGTPAVI